MIDDMLISYKMMHIKNGAPRRKVDGAQEERVSYMIAQEHIPCISYIKFVMMEFILTTDKKENIDDFGKNKHDLLQEDHNLAKTTI